MEFFLAREKETVFATEFAPGIRGKGGTAVMMYYCDEDSPGYDKKFSEILENMLNSFQDWVAMDIRIMPKDNHSSFRGEALLQFNEEMSYLKELAKLPAVENVLVNVKVELQSHSAEDEETPPNFQLTSKDMIVLNGDDEITCQDFSVPFEDNAWYDLFFARGVGITALVTVKVTINQKQLEYQNINNHNEMDVFRAMLHDEVHSDMVIISSEGIPVKCHKCVMCTYSPVFRRMFEHTDMVEAQTDRVEMPDMSEENVRAFLEYLYYRSKERPREKPSVAFHLWIAADKYEIIPDMKGAMREILLSKPLEWYNADVALQVFQIARNIDSEEELKMKAVHVLKRMSPNLHNSAAYKEMFETNPNAAMELYQLSIALQQ